MSPCAAALQELLSSGKRRARVLANTLSRQGFNVEQIKKAKKELGIVDQRSEAAGTLWIPAPKPKRSAGNRATRCRCGNTTTQRHPETSALMCLACQVKEGVF